MFDLDDLGLDGIDGFFDDDGPDDDQDDILAGAAQPAYELVDTDGDGMLDTRMAVEEVDLDGDGIADSVAYVFDRDFDMNPDEIVTPMDMDGDGVIDQYMVLEDNDADQNFESQTIMSDSDGDGIFEQAVYSQDTNMDGVFDTHAVFQDLDGDGVFEIVEEFQESLPDITYPGAEIDYPNFDPDSADMEGVIGNPEDAMDSWHLQETDSSCAVAAQEFVLEALTGQEFTEEDLRELGIENGWYSPESGTYTYDVGRILEANGLSVEQSTGNTIQDLEECLSNGGGVVVSVDADEIWYGEEDDWSSDDFAPGTGANHAVQVIGIDYSEGTPMVILNDSGCPDGCGMMVPMDVFVDAWEDSGCFMAEAYA